MQPRWWAGTALSLVALLVVGCAGGSSTSVDEPTPDVEDLLEALARMELTHAERLEYLYERAVGRGSGRGVRGLPAR
jgi:hypothetical protein